MRLPSLPVLLWALAVTVLVWGCRLRRAWYQGRVQNFLCGVLMALILWLAWHVIGPM